MKVIKAYSLDIETVELLERYCDREDALNGGTSNFSRSKLVNEAIQWYMGGDNSIAELVESRDALLQKFGDAMREKHNSKVLEKTNLPWWRRLLLGQ